MDQRNRTNIFHFSLSLMKLSKYEEVLCQQDTKKFSHASLGFAGWIFIGSGSVSFQPPECGMFLAMLPQFGTASDILYLLFFFLLLFMPDNSWQFKQRCKPLSKHHYTFFLHQKVQVVSSTLNSLICLKQLIKQSQESNACISYSSWSTLGKV